MDPPRRPDRALVALGLGASRIRVAEARARIASGAREAARARGHARVEVVEAPDAATLRAACSEAVADGFGLVVAIGGDGTVREAAGAVSGSSVPLAIVPAGTGNLLASTLGIPRAERAALDTIRAGVTRRIDRGEARWERGHASAAGPAAPPRPPAARPSPPAPAVASPPPSPFVVAAGVGLDARFLAVASGEAKRRYGIGAYLLAALGQAGDLRPRPTVLVVDGVRHELEAVEVLIANAGELIPGRLGPRLPVRPDDGTLHVFVVRGGILGSVVGALELLAAADDGWSATGRALRLRATEVRVEMGGEPPDPVEVDGDPVGTGWLEAQVVPAALDVLVPAGRSG